MVATSSSQALRWRSGHGVSGYSRRSAVRGWRPEVNDGIVDRTALQLTGTVRKRLPTEPAGGGLAALINNAGVGALGAAEEFPLERARGLFEINLWGAARLAQLLLPLLRAGAAPEQPTCLVNVGSLIADYPVPFHALYAASKGALRAYTLALRGELAGHGVAAVLLEPGDIATGTTPLQHAAPGSPYGAAFARATAARTRRSRTRASQVALAGAAGDRGPADRRMIVVKAAVTGSAVRGR